MKHASTIFNVLKLDHNKTKQVFVQLEDTTNKQVKKQEDLLAMLAEEWIPHMRGEEKLFFPLLKKHKESYDKALEAQEEHHVAENVFAELDQMPKDSETWGAKAKVLQELVEHHVEEEESDIFDLAQKVLSHEQMKEVLQAFEKEKQTAQRLMKKGALSHS